MRYKEIAEQLKKASTAELRLGCNNAGVFGGYHLFAGQQLDKLAYISVLPAKEELRAVLAQLKDYPKLDRQNRKDVIQHTLLVLDKILTNQSAELEICINKVESKVVASPTKAKLSPVTQLESKISGGELSLQYLKNVGPQRVSLLHKLDIFNIEDLLYHFPRDYQDRSNPKPVHQLQDGQTETFQGVVLTSQELRPRRGLTITKVAIHDGQGTAYAVWFNQSFIKKQMKPGINILVSGKVERKFGNVQIAVSDFEISDGSDPVHAGRIVPIYATTGNLNGRTLRSIMKSAVDNYSHLMEEFLPGGLLKKFRMPQRVDALFNVHFPQELADVAIARRRFIFEELFLLQLGLAMNKVGKVQEETGIAHRKDGTLMKDFMAALPFALTEAQQRVYIDIAQDMESNKPMNRLIQGDVGSGKTVVAALGLLKTVASGYQGALMAPTEILAEQHYLGLKEFFADFDVKVGLLTGSQTKKERELILSDIQAGNIDLVIGTHALIQEGVEFGKLGLAVTDEQHRFGVKQRAQLKEKGYNPDILVMTATPIPRTLAMTLYGDLDISVIDALPPGRKPVKTYWVTSQSTGKIFKLMAEKISEGRQVYIVCPLVEESEKVDLAAATGLAEELQTNAFPQYRVGLLHGRMKALEKEETMEEFRAGHINILVSTTVIEVGVNVPNATVMVVWDAERFGLAQLHQLRGRVGRGAHQSYCILVANPKTEEGRARMQIMQSTSDGFVIAEEDLKLRGPGEFFGTRQSGLPDLKIANILRDVKILEEARQAAFALVEVDPGLRRPEHKNLLLQVKKKFKNRLTYINIS